MKKAVCFLVVLFLLFCFGCRKQSEGKATESSKKQKENTAFFKFSYKTDWLQNDPIGSEFKEYTLCKKLAGNFSADQPSTPRYAYLFRKDERNGENSAFYYSYLAVETDSWVFIKDLTCGENGEYLTGCLGEDMFVCDINGDGIDEIALQQCVDLFGGAGQYWSRIFKVYSDRITEIFTSKLPDKFDTGFEGILTDGFKLRIKNKFTGYSKMLDLSKNPAYVGVYFDENGSVLTETKGENEILVDTFFEFTPEDVDGDGALEIACLQYVSLYGHSDYIGNAKCALKYDSETKEFRVINTEFIEYRR